jgi:hypothetical protein
LKWIVVITMDDLCELLVNTKLDFDECNELMEFIDMKIISIKEIKKTKERYLRYLKGIDIWEVEGVSYKYIRDNIIDFLNICDNDFVQKLKLMKRIDMQIKNMLDNHK